MQTTAPKPLVPAKPFEERVREEVLKALKEKSLDVRARAGVESIDPLA